MQTASLNSSPNKILSGLSNADQALMHPHLESVPLELRRVLEVPNKTIEHSYFIEDGLASIVAGNGHQKRLEVGLIGREGMTGLAIVLGGKSSPHENFMQVAGSGQRISADNMRGVMDQSRSLERAFLLFAQSFMNQTASTALSNGTATVERAFGAMACHG